MKNDHSNTLILRAVIVPAAFLVILAAALLWQIQSFKKSTEWVDQADQVIGSSQELLTLAVDMETGVRGYLNTGKDEFLEPYAEAKSTIDAKFGTLNRLVSDNAVQQSQLAMLHRRLSEWQQYAEHLIDLRRRGEGVDYRTSLEGKQLMDSLREEQRTFVATQERMRRERVQSVEAKSRLVTIACIMLSLGTAGFLVLFVRNRMRLIAVDLENEKQFRTLADAIPQLCWMADANGSIFWYNRRWYEYTGTTLEQMEGWGWQSVHDPEMLPKVLERWKSSISTGVPLEMVFPLRNAEGTLRPFLTRVMPVKDATGRVMSWFGTNTDITEQKKAEEEAKRTRDLLEMFVLNAPAGLAMFDRKMRYLRVSRKWQIDSGLGTHALEGKSHYEVFPNLPEAWKESYRRGLAGEMLSGEGYWTAANGSKRYIHWAVHPWGDSGTESGGIILFFDDLTERKQAEESLREQASLLDLAHDTIMVRELDGTIRFWNHGAESLYGYSRDEAIGKVSHELLRTEFPEPLAEIDDRFRKNARWEGELVHITKDNKTIVVASRWALQKLENGQPDRLMETNSDITQRKQAEQEIQELNAELERRVMARTAELEAANKELESFSYSVSHDLRAPLRAVDGYSKAVLEDYGPSLPEEGREYLQTISRGAARMGELIDDLLAFSRLGRQTLTRAPVDTYDLVQQCLDELEWMHANRVVEFSVGELPSCLGDRALLKQVWANLLSNAIKFTAHQKRASVEIGAQMESGRVEYFVRDNGAGFDMKYANKLFGVFQRLHRADEFEGTGVGLAIVQRIVHRHGGRVWADAALNQGATFHFTVAEEREGECE